MKHVIEEIGSEFWIEDVIAVINDVFEKMVLTGTIDYCYPVEQP